ncbi:MAG: 23S rRNA (adenine(2503)-C(2))-methyltransferase RlmN [Gemmatimonadota bacterium]|nr:MAG: 23S rRNA (adenine(2503)-C(2))-methyltransferase RlmN [Gemmatimonadota bacterium]
MNLLDLTPKEAQSTIAGWIADRGEPPYRTRQILPRLWRRPATTWSGATDLPQDLRVALDREFPLPRPALERLQQSADGTVKFLWQLDRDTAIESVLIPEGRRRTVCISSQAGCAYGCVFCATGLMGFQRQLSPWEITAQVRELVIADQFETPSHVVFMGMGEPLHNWAAVDTALTILNDPRGLGIGARRITVSTVGIVPNLERLARRPEQFKVALSLHSPSGAGRSRLMPVERKYPLELVLETLRSFSKRITFEYVMIAGENDADDDAIELARIARSLGALVNLLPLHPGGVPGFEPTPLPRIRQFATRLRSLGAHATIRQSRGLDIAGACGQLRIEVTASGNVATENHTGVEQ